MGGPAAARSPYSRDAVSLHFRVLASNLKKEKEPLCGAGTCLEEFGSEAFRDSLRCCSQLPRAPVCLPAAVTS